MEPSAVEGSVARHAGSRGGMKAVIAGSTVARPGMLARCGCCVLVPYTGIRRGEVLTGGAHVEDRINYFERMLADNPDNPTGLLALANEYRKVERYEDEAAVLERYVSSHEDEGNAWARLGEVLQRLGREDEARSAYETGIRQAEKFGHTGMAEDLRLAIVELRE